MTCRDEILDCVERFMCDGPLEFTIQDVVDAMRAAGTTYADSTIRTHVSSRMCANAPVNHGVTYDDLLRVGRGLYRLAR